MDAKNDIAIGREDAVGPEAPGPLDECGFRQLAASRLRPLPEIWCVARLKARKGQDCRDLRRGDWDLNPGLAAEPFMQQAPKPAAVLVPVIARDQLSVLLTLRPQHMKTHAGQISFPGGKLEEGDNGPLDTALRESQEEVGLAPSFVEPLGLLDSYRTGTGYLISPVVALVRPGFKLTPERNEVAEAFEVPLAFLLDPRNHQRESLDWQGRRRFFHVIEYGDRYIWGATAGMIKNLHERLNATCSDS